MRYSTYFAIELGFTRVERSTTGDDANALRSHFCENEKKCQIVAFIVVMVTFSMPTSIIQSTWLQSQQINETKFIKHTLPACMIHQPSNNNFDYLFNVNRFIAQPKNKKKQKQQLSPSSTFFTGDFTF